MQKRFTRSDWGNQDKKRDINEIYLSGIIKGKPTVLESERSGLPYAFFNLSVAGGRRSQLISCQVWGKRKVEYISSLANEGGDSDTEIFVKGRINSYSTGDRQTGNQQTRVNVVANEVWTLNSHISDGDEATDDQSEKVEKNSDQSLSSDKKDDQKIWDEFMKEEE